MWRPVNVYMSRRICQQSFNDQNNLKKATIAICNNAKVENIFARKNTYHFFSQLSQNALPKIHSSSTSRHHCDRQVRLFSYRLQLSGHPLSCRFLLVHFSANYAEYLNMREIRKLRPTSGCMRTQLTEKQWTRSKGWIYTVLQCLDDVNVTPVLHAADIPMPVQANITSAVQQIPSSYYAEEFRQLRDRQDVVVEVISLYAMFFAHTDLELQWS